MANEEHLEILKRGVKVWNAWRKKMGYMFPDLAQTSLRGVDLASADLSLTVLRKADMGNANLKAADLTGANLDGASLASSDASYARFPTATLVGTDLESANLDMAHMFDAKLNGANLKGTSLSDADFRLAKLHGADFRGAEFYWTNFEEADLTQAILSNTSLYRVNFNRALLMGAEIGLCGMSDCVFSSVDLSGVKGLETVYHEGPSTIGIDTIYLSKGKIPHEFLRGAGVPQKLIDYIPSLIGEGIKYYSCFISHSSKDEEFTKKLHRDLQGEQVRCWFFPEDAKTGREVWEQISVPIGKFDKVVVICSENSLQSRPVLREIERALQREDSEKRNILFPVRIDDYLFETWEHPRKADFMSKVVGDFRNWKNHDEYQNAFTRLLRDLEA